MYKYLTIVLIFLSVSAHAQQKEFTSIFNGKDLSGWTTYLQGKGLNKDPRNVITVKDGVVHVTGQDFGYFATNKTYKDFHLQLQFKWGEKKFPPRENDKRDAGICFHVSPNDNRIWPKCVEMQIQEGDVGDLWLIDSVTAFVDGIQTQPKGYARVVKNKDAEYKNGEWNKVEVINRKGKFQFIVNGVVVNEGEYLSITSGRILLQSEGAEVYYKDIRIKEFTN